MVSSAGKREELEMRILWAACPQPGSLFPAVPLVEALTARGHSVTAIADGAAKRTFADLGVEFLPATRRDAVGEAGAGSPDVNGRQAWHRAYAQGWFADVRAALAEDRYDAALVDPLEPGADLAAEAAGIPSVSYAHWAMDEAGVDVFFATHLWDGVGDAARAFVEFWNDQRAAVGLGPEPRPPAEHRWYRHSRQLALILGLPELVFPRAELPAYARRIGPSVWDPPQPGALPDVFDRREGKRHAVLASVSTVGPADERLLSVLAEAVRGEDVDLLLTIPHGQPPKDLPRNVTAVPFLPHDVALLSRIDCVISNSGYGSVTRAASAGRPMLLLPRRGDQFVAARGAVHAEVAISLAANDVSAPAVREALTKLLTDGRYRQRANALAAAAATYDAPTQAAKEIENLLA